MFEGMNNKRKGIEIDPMTGLEVPKELEVYEPPYLARVGRRIEGSVRPTTSALISHSHERSSLSWSRIWSCSAVRKVICRQLCLLV